MTTGPEINNPLAESDWCRQYQEGLQRCRDAIPINKAALFDVLSDAEVTLVTVSFDGYGDQGQIESINVMAADVAVELPSQELEMMTTSHDGSVRYERRTVEEAIEALVYDLLEVTHDGWEINDGSYGKFTFDVKEGTITLGYNERYTEYFEDVF